MAANPSEKFDDPNEHAASRDSMPSFGGTRGFDPEALPGFFARYFWVIAKNVLGWFFILSALPIGLALPGPGGLPLFLVGFAMVSFPGKRKLTARAMSGRPLQLLSKRYRYIRIVAAVVLPLIALLIVNQHPQLGVRRFFSPPLLAMGMLIFLAAAMVSWLIAFFVLLLANLLLHYVPRLRRKIRPWLRHRGIRLLPPRRSRRTRFGRRPWLGVNEEIIEFDRRHTDRAREFWGSAKGWIKRGAGVLITLAIFAWIGKPIVTRWDEVSGRIMATSPLRFLLASFMFAAFLFVFRVNSWRQILIGLGRRLPMAAATRIWSTSELARYLPGVIWQVVGRVYLVRPYGVDAATCSASQLMELTTFLLANVLVGLGCLPWFAEGLPQHIRKYLYAASAIAPVLLALLHPKIFYGGINWLLRKLKRQPIVKQVPARWLIALLAWAIVGLAWQGLAIWMLVGQKAALDLAFSNVGLIIGAYCLSWCAGFLAFWAPGGIGVRELILVATLRSILPKEIKDQFFNGDRTSFNAFLAFLAVLLRLWTIAGEMILATIAYATDYRGALGRADAPGRLEVTPPAAGSVSSRN